ncbi:MAG: hypothetical protein K2R98_32355 [Gemmataceae bacterium]|nr:hypothetical protein [Gemmataceae bacterium]
MLHRPSLRLLPLLTLFLAVQPVQAELRSLEIIKREPFAGGMAFGEVGPYEKIVAIGKFAVDPKHTRNSAIIDLALAPTNGDGKVEFEADVFILMPKDPAKGNRALLYEVNNRGNKNMVRFFNQGGGGNDPTNAADAGDGFLMRRGYTLVWCGWIGELLPGGNRMLLKAPVAIEKGKPITGPVRYEFVPDQAAESISLAGPRGNHGSYSPTKTGEAEGTLTWRKLEGDERIPIPRAQWSLERSPVGKVENGVGPTLPEIKLRLSGGFRLGYIYELICEAEGPIVQGLGYAAVRDLVSFLRYDTSAKNPCRNAEGQPVITRAHAFGISQSGRFLRNYLYLGFNADEANRKVFDGLIPHVAGGGLGFFNHRFAQPTRHNAQHEAHLYPIDYFPFTYGETTDPFTKKTDGILRRTLSDNAKLMPKVMHTQSSSEYWNRSGSLVHTTPLGTKDVDIPDEVRIYTFGGTQHGPAADPPGRGNADNLLNPGDFRPQMRALLDALDLWVKDGTAPPPSVYPRIEQGTLVHWRQPSTGFPALPGVRYPEVIQRPPSLDFGPDFDSKGIISNEPPKSRGEFTVLVPKSGPDGNDLGCLSPIEVAVPVATHTGWNLRRRDVGAEGQLAALMGSYFPLPKTKAERQKSGDPRDSIEERYASFDEYQKRFAAACEDQVKRRYLLKEDADRFIKSRDKYRDLFPNANK